MNDNSYKYMIPSLERALCILELLAKERNGCSVTEIAEKLNIPKNSVFRIMKTLEVRGYVNEISRTYYFSPKLLALGYLGAESTNLISASKDVMYDLRDDVNETVFVGALSENKVVILDELPSFQYIKFTIEVGHKVPIYASAPGKAILAYLPKKEQDDIINHITLIRFTDRTIPSKKAMLEALLKIYSTGYAFDLGEEVEEIYCVASPILDFRNYPVGSLWLAGPKFRLEAMDLDAVGKMVKSNALIISRKFGYEPVFFEKG